MFYSDNQQDLRQAYFDAWQKAKDKKNLLTPLEQQLVDVIVDHPEYHDFLEQKNPDLYKIYSPELGETNPFLHLALHLAIREQITTNRPQGIRSCFYNLLDKMQDKLHAEHAVMEQLAHCLWLAQKNNQAIDEKEYLLAIEALALS